MSQPPDSEGLEVLHSPEQVALHLPIAGPSSRILAYAIDYLLILLIQFAAALALLLSTPLAGWLQSQLQEVSEQVEKGAGPGLSSAVFTLMAVFVLLQLAIEWGYFVFFETAMHGRSPGKRAIGLRVLRDGGLPLGVRESLVRNALRAVDILPGNYVVGLAAMVASKQGKRLGDLAAGTVVIRLDRVERPAPLPAPGPAGAASFRFDRAQLARLGAAELQLARQSLRRSGELGSEAAEQALERAVEALRVRLEYAPVAPGERRAFLHALLHEVRER